MAKIRQVPGFEKFNAETSRPINFVFGMILLMVSIFFMFTRESLLRPSYQLDAFFLLLASVLSLWAAMSDKKRTIFLINFTLGIVFILSALMITLLRFLDLELMFAVLFDYTGGDAAIHGLLGLIFFINAINSRRESYDDKTTTSQIDSIKEVF
ncbi:MAG: hypothetical protein ACLGHN_05890 [Bacteriovoracia bacterium]